MNIILASASPRRMELLKRITENFSVVVSEFDENSVTYSGDCMQYVKEIALGKAMDVAGKLNKSSIVIGCDTIVYHKGRVLGKPKDKQEALHMLENLSGDMHQVYSGVAVIDTENNSVKTDYMCTDVFFSKLSYEEINNYIDTLDWVDKAGAYGIQGKAGIFVEKIHGCYYNVVGLPLNLLYHMLMEMGVNL